MGTATEQVKENGKKAKVTVQTWKTFDEAKAFIEGLGLEPATDAEAKKSGLTQPTDVMVKLVRVEKGTSNREYEKSTVYKTEDGHQLTWIESAYMTTDLPKPDGVVVFRFFQKFAALDTQGAEELAGAKLVEYVNDSWDLAIRQRVKPSMVQDATAAGLMEAEASMEEAIEKQVRNTAKFGLMSEAEARIVVIANRKRAGLPVPEGE